MSNGIRLPTLYPMPRDMDQYWVCYRSTLDEPPEEEYIERLRTRLRKENGGEYAPSMINKLFTRVVETGFIRKDTGRVLPPDDQTYRTWDATWDGTRQDFVTYVRETLLKWGKLFPDGLVLLYDILSHLSNESLSSGELMTALTGDDDNSGKYDGRDRYADRTIREVLKLLESAALVQRQDGKYRATADAPKFRTEFRKRDTYHRVEWILNKVDPASTDIFTPQEKVKLSKHYMYRECGGKYRSEIIDAVHDIIFKYPYHKKLREGIEEAIEAEKEERENLKREIQRLDSAVGQEADNLRSISKLELIREALQGGRKEQAWEILQGSSARFSWESVRQLRHSGPEWSFTPKMEPYGWQRDALNAWKANDYRGVLEVVTGAGKTVLALAAADELLSEKPNTCITVLVPTKVLMYQWARELARVLGVPADDIGLRGDGHKDSFAEGKKVIVTIINSAIQDDYLIKEVERLPDDNGHLLVADECHRYRGEEFRRAFQAPFDYSLGLSATPVDPNTDSADGHNGNQEDVIFRALGDIFYEYSYQEALADNIIQEFVVNYVGVELTQEERRLYDAYTKRIGKCLDRIRGRYGPRIEAMSGPLFASLHTILNTDDNPDPAIGKYFAAVRERKDLVFSARNRKWAYLDIIDRRLTEGDRGKEQEDKVIVFHERIDNLEEIVAPTDRRRVVEEEQDLDKFRGLGSIEEAGADGVAAKYRSDPVEKHVDENLTELFFKSTFKPVMYHSGHSSQAWNEFGMAWFREGIANVMLSVKALVEGVDVPAANVGIIRASSSSVRQRIQTTGRILRRAAGKERPAQLFVIYVRDTTDERIFRGIDWSEQLGEQSVRSHHWYPPEEPGEISGVWEDRGDDLPEAPEYGEDDEVEEFDVEELEPGDAYPGKYAGWEYHVDAEGRPFKKTRDGRRFVANDEIKTAAKRIFDWKRGGKFVVTPDNHIVTKVKNRGLLFVGLVDGEIELEEPSRAGMRGEAPTFEELFGSE